MNKQDRIEKRDAALNAVDFETEQAAIKQACVVDIRPTIPATAVDLYHQWTNARNRRPRRIIRRYASRSARGLIGAHADTSFGGPMRKKQARRSRKRAFWLCSSVFAVITARYRPLNRPWGLSFACPKARRGFRAVSVRLTSVYVF